MPKYQRYPSQPLTGALPSMVQMGPSDLLPSSGTAPAYLRRLETGRHLGALGAIMTNRRRGIQIPTVSSAQAYMRNLSRGGVGALGTDTPSTCSSCVDDVPLLTDGSAPSDDSSYLRTLEKDDDVEGNGIFDGARRRPINYPDAGIFASSYGIPGYIARGRSFAESEVIDATTGTPVVYVPGGAVSIDDTAKIAYMEGRAMAFDRETGMARPQPLRTVPIDSVAMDTRPITGKDIAVVPETVPRVAAVAAQAASMEVSRQVVTPTQAPMVPAAVVPVPSSGQPRVMLALLAGALGFGIGYVVSRKDKPSTP